MGAVRSLSSWRRNGWEEKLVKYWTVDGLSGGQIASILGISRGAVLGKLHRMGLTGSRGGGTHQTQVVKKSGTKSKRGKNWHDVDRILKGKRNAPRPGATQTVWRRARGLPAPVGDGITTIRVLPSDPSVSERVTLTDKKRSQCSWPFDDDTFCGRQRVGVHTSYCAEHHIRAYRPARTPDFPSRTRS
jgi:hypothetical protein